MKTNSAAEREQVLDMRRNPEVRKIFECPHCGEHRVRTPGSGVHWVCQRAGEHTPMLSDAQALRRLDEVRGVLGSEGMDASSNPIPTSVSKKFLKQLTREFGIRRLAKPKTREQKRLDRQRRQADKEAKQHQERCGVFVKTRNKRGRKAPQPSMFDGSDEAMQLSHAGAGAE